ncbi:MAG: 30S ribosomal protein S2 [Candidatus Moranbacteria bacterium]|nr:30S ribosomal protein S2 [Candidatus Moranbacteria bacterium]
MAKSQTGSVKDSAVPAAKTGQSEAPFETFDFSALDTGFEAMLAAGVHFGHLKSRLHPSMRPLVFMTRQNVNIIDLGKTSEYLERAGKFLAETAKAGKPILFVGMKKHTHPFVLSLAKRLGEPYVIERWLGGTLTNYSVIRNRTRYFRETEEKLEKGEFQMYTKFERQRLLEEVERLRKRMGGIKEMRELPGAVVVADGKEGKLAIREAHALGIPVVAIIDTNADATQVEYPVPGNDDALSSLRLLLGALGKAVAETKGIPMKG